MSEAQIQSRSPIITIMGHIDHGKTTLLDYIRSTKVTQKEKGGITQHVGAYQISYKNGFLTFIDTPGHEAFTSIRSRGIKTSDIIILVVAADDGVMPQTEEAIEIAKQTQLPIIVAITKIDKEDVDTNKIKANLSEYDLVAEEWGGDTIFVELSSLTGQGVDELLEMIHLVAEMTDITANFSKAQTDGFILESFLDSRMGPLSDIVILNGTLAIGDAFVVGDSTFGKIKRIQDDQGNQIKLAVPGQPVRILGLKGVAKAGDTFRVVKDEKTAEHIISQSQKEPENIPVMQQIVEKDKELNIILKAEATGSLEAVAYALEQIQQLEMKINIVAQEIGDVNATDIKEAQIHNAVIIAFGLKPNKKMLSVAEQQDVVIKYYQLIYELTDEIRDILHKMTEPKIIRNVFGELRIIQVFKDQKKHIILGGKVDKGKIVRKSLIEIKNSDDEVIVQGKLEELQQEKSDTSEVLDGRECGLKIQTTLKKEIPSEGSLLISYEQTKRKV
jgi:translation initiation factor IF-2